jgi:iron complex transport system substrate-binding protein
MNRITASTAISVLVTLAVAAPVHGAAGATTTPGGTTATGSDAFPVTIEHKYGSTTIESKPERVVSVGFAEHEGLLAIGVEPVGVRDWYGDQPYATWPWAQDELGDLQPAVIAADALNFEQIAALQPDVIVGISSGMTDSDYATLSEIAPTIAQPADYIEYGTPWDVQLEINGLATGHSAEAAQAIAETKALFEDVRSAHPEWEGQSAAVAFIFDTPGAYASGDNRPQALAELGLVTPPEFDELAGDQFWFVVSNEEVGRLDADVIIWVVDGDAGAAAIRDLPLRPSMPAFQQGREIVADPLVSGAFSHASPLSYPYFLERVVPELELALDGDPATVVPSAAAIDPAA